MRLVVYLALLLLASCDGQEAAERSQNGQDSANTECTVDGSFSLAEGCNKTLANLTCSRRIFTPDSPNSKSIQRACIDEDNPNTCTHVKDQYYDTSHLLGLEPPASFDPGADYNRTEVICNASAFYGYGASLKGALLDWQRACSEGSS